MVFCPRARWGGTAKAKGSLKRASERRALSLSHARSGVEKQLTLSPPLFLSLSLYLSQPPATLLQFKQQKSHPQKVKKYEVVK